MSATTDDPCQMCGRSTAPGSGLFVNRIPADEGWGCAECYSECGYSTPRGDLCADCGDEHYPEDGTGPDFEPRYLDDYREAGARVECIECGTAIYDPAWPQEVAA